jgi:uncharacterized RDD family membrane protein YckC
VIPEEEEVEMPESNWGRRAGAYFIDLLIIFLLTYGIFLLFISEWLIFIPLSMDGLLMFIIFWLVYGIISIAYFGGLEGGIGATVGKGMMSLEVYSLDTENMTAGKGFGRSLSKFIWFLVGADVGLGSGKGDPRQRSSDLWQNTIVGDFIPVEAPMPEYRGGEIYVKPIEEKELEDDDAFKDLPIPRELLSGNCPYCGTPYNIVPSKDKSTWSGLWGSRCIWCNHKVFEHYRRHVQPGNWV